MAIEKLEAIGIDAICERILAGETYQQLADSQGISVGTVHRFLNISPEHIEKSTRARTSSAEAWLDKGLQKVLDACKKSGDVDPSAARAYAQECARRAAIRNPQYREKHDVEHSGKVSIGEFLDKI